MQTYRSVKLTSPQPGVVSKFIIIRLTSIVTDMQC